MGIPAGIKEVKSKGRPEAELRLRPLVQQLFVLDTLNRNFFLVRQYLAEIIRNIL